MDSLSDELRELLKRRLKRRISKCSQLGVTARPALVGYRNGKAEEVEDLIKDLGEFFNKLDAKDEQVDRLQKELANQKAHMLSYGEALPQAMNEIARLQKENKKLNQIIFEYETMPDED